MGFADSSKLWPSRRIAYSIDDRVFAPGSTGRANIDAAIAHWNSNTVLSFQPRTTETDFITFPSAIGYCASPVGRQGGNQTVSCALPMDAAGQPGGAITVATQQPGLQVAVFVDTSGRLAVSVLTPDKDGGTWENPAGFSDAGIGVPGRPVALAKQTPQTLTGAFIDASGAFSVTWVNDFQAWNPPVRISGRVAPPGSPVSLCKQTDGILTAAFIDDGGFLSIAWVVGIEAWQGPIRIGAAPVAQPGTAVSLCKQTNDILTAAFIDSAGALSIAWVVGIEAWQGPIRISDPVAAPGTPVTLGRQDDLTMVASFIESDGTLGIAWVTGGAAWNPPVKVGSGPAGAAVISTTQQTDITYTAAFIDSAGQMKIAWVIPGQSWNGPVAIGAAFATLPPVPAGGYSVAIYHQSDDSGIAAIYFNESGELSYARVENGAPWSSPRTVRGGFSTGSVIHEIGHAIGLYHEHTRTDRDSFVTVTTANCAPGTNIKVNFDIVATGTTVGAYDYGSIMHYSRTGFAMPGTETITPVTPQVIGQRNGLSAGDIAGVAQLYGSAASDIRVETLDVKIDVPVATQPVEPVQQVQQVRPIDVTIERDDLKVAHRLNVGTKLGAATRRFDDSQ
ncbi:hypothetical protein ASF62_06185 [Leifsonia sp. Leaf325]|nr:M12 family metallopeptidase [Leifsonia sp. Leaf325]KQQ93782.1 hypothetical protein ASF62_06185 [Leifsonia sp. Leaf325]